MPNHVLSSLIRESILIHVPHAGILIPSTTGYVADPDKIDDEIELLTDWDTDELFAVDGIAQVVCPWSRVFCDVERLLKDEPMEAKGMGFFYTHCDDGSPLREDIEGAKDIAESYYKIHHETLEYEIERRLFDHGSCHLIDAHSFPDIPCKRDQHQAHDRPDICLGTVRSSTPNAIIDYYRNSFSRMGLKVQVDYPYKGTIVPTEYADDTRFTSIMIEINRKLYDKVDDGVDKINDAIQQVLNFSR